MNFIHLNSYNKDPILLIEDDDLCIDIIGNRENLFLYNSYDHAIQYTTEDIYMISWYSNLEYKTTIKLDFLLKANTYLRHIACIENYVLICYSESEYSDIVTYYNPYIDIDKCIDDENWWHFEESYYDIDNNRLYIFDMCTIYEIILTNNILNKKIYYLNNYIMDLIIYNNILFVTTLNEGHIICIDLLYNNKNNEDVRDPKILHIIKNYENSEGSYLITFDKNNNTFRIQGDTYQIYDKFNTFLGRNEVINIKKISESENNLIYRDKQWTYIITDYTHKSINISINNNNKIIKSYDINYVDTVNEQIFFNKSIYTIEPKNTLTRYYKNNKIIYPYNVKWFHNTDYMYIIHKHNDELKLSVELPIWNKYTHKLYPQYYKNKVLFYLWIFKNILIELPEDMQYLIISKIINKNEK